MFYAGIVWNTKLLSPKMPFELLFQETTRSPSNFQAVYDLMKILFVQDSCKSRDYWVRLGYKAPRGLRIASRLLKTVLHEQMHSVKTGVSFSLLETDQIFGSRAEALYNLMREDGFKKHTK